MKHLAAAIALTCGAFATAAAAEDIGEGYKSQGQCMAALSQANLDDWKSQQTDGKLIGAGSYVQQFYCAKIGKLWYIVPIW